MKSFFILSLILAQNAFAHSSDVPHTHFESVPFIGLALIIGIGAYLAYKANWQNK